MIDAIAWKLQTGSQRVHLPEKYGSWKGIHNRPRNRTFDGTRERVLTALLAQADAEEDLDWAVSVGSTILRAHQHAVGARPAHLLHPRRSPAAEQLFRQR